MGYPNRQQQQSDDLKVGLWPKEGRSGATYYAGQDEENWYNLFPKNSDNPNAPTFDLKIKPKTEEERNWQPNQRGQGGGQQRGQGGQQRGYTGQGGNQRGGGYGGQQRGGNPPRQGGGQQRGYPPQQSGGRASGGRPPIDEGQYGGVGPDDAPWDV